MLKAMLNAQKSAEVIVADKVKDRINRSLKYDPERRDEQWMQKTTQKATCKEIVRNTKGM